MTSLQQRLDAISGDRLLGQKRGLEKESLRSQPDGKLALTPHPAALGSALTHPHITTDYSESQLELITGVHASVDACLAELTEVHQYTARVLHKPGQSSGDEMMWASSMPCGLPTDETIPLGRYGSSNVGRAKSVYRMGLGHRYGRRMQTISGIHYNWSMPGIDNDGYFALIRNFRRHAFLLLALFGASPAVCSSFLAGREHDLQPLGNGGSFYKPFGTTLRMGRLGYQSDAQATLGVSYNGLEGYAASLHDALTRPWPAYEAIGVRNPGGDYNQLATTLLQIENEFYGTIRPKRVIQPGERPLHALRERGVEYVEVRLLDLNPFETIGIAAPTLRFLDVFLMHCLLSESPPDTPDEIHEITQNQQLTASRGREPGLRLTRHGESLTLTQWGAEIIGGLMPIAQAMDAAHGGDAHVQAVAAAGASLAAPDTLPSARVLAAVRNEHSDSFVSFVRAQSLQTHNHLLDLPWSSGQQARYEAMAAKSLDDQRAIEANDTMPFDVYREEYTSPARLGRAAYEPVHHDV
ncbi:glutamate--cysteine ligase [Hydrogenophaga crassostreae]|uniref:Glutamate--cysteine ligase n=1 Tax=Hydrogenophaga crassostreae TaxID=1763535 RepID=A0A167H8P5_9BURK|nr:glutamate--cysteine ligase [Hydrogenophaga crassostreae]AOW12622.1 glutamate--cysteine ligase [Hydrogenophaga crassostreae]OAD40493.1 glutamate--cysteine ligase [Hydrogenophaga crassostreae]